MKAQLRDTRARSKSSIAISAAIHVVAAVALMSITFHYNFDQLLTRPEPMKAVPVKYVKLAPKAQPGAVRSTPSKVEAPRARSTPPIVLAPANIPAGVPAPTPPVAATGVAIGAGGSTTAVGGNDPGIGFGIRPGIPDGRLVTNPMSIARAPETEGQKAERALAAIYGQYLDSARAAAANPQRAPGDWSWGGADGDKWGWDQNGIHLGGITIPNVVLAALPIGQGPGGRNMNAITEMRTESFITSDIKSHSGIMSQDEFTAAVKRVRERVDRERREKMEREKARAAKPPPCCSQERD